MPLHRPGLGKRDGLDHSNRTGTRTDTGRRMMDSVTKRCIIKLDLYGFFDNALWQVVWTDQFSFLG